MEPRYTYRAGDLPAAQEFSPYRKRVVTYAVRIPGPFRVETLEGPLDCADGWLALDADSNPYPIDAAVFAKIYEPADDGEAAE